jgi:hypothetical protein
MPSYTSSTPQERPDHVEPGDYEVEVVDAIETISKGGHEMIELKLKTSAGSYLYDFLVFIPTAFWKIDAFRAATGEVVEPEQDVEITADHVIGRTGTARLTVEEYNGKKRNKVVAWIIGDAKPVTQPKPARRNDNEPF